MRRTGKARFGIRLAICASLAAALSPFSSDLWLSSLLLGVASCSFVVMCFPDPATD